jgi:hypothetical protein
MPIGAINAVSVLLQVSALISAGDSTAGHYLAAAVNTAAPRVAN